jgi:hypothetical protein
MLTDIILEKLAAQNIKLGRFQEITSRLLSSGIILRDEDGVEQRLYDDARRIEDLLREVFSIFAFRLLHDAKNEFYRLYAPGAQILGMSDDCVEPVVALRTKLSADFVAAALALRFLYQQGLVEGGNRLTDGGEVLINFEELAATLQTHLKRPLSESANECKHLLAELKRHRIIQFNSAFDIGDEDALIAIRPTILGIISDDALISALDKEVPGLASETERLNYEA